MRLPPSFPRNLNGDAAIEKSVPVALVIRLPTLVIRFVATFPTCTMPSEATFVTASVIAVPIFTVDFATSPATSTAALTPLPMPTMTSLLTLPSPMNTSLVAVPSPERIEPNASPALVTIVKVALVNPTRPSPIARIPAFAVSARTSVAPLTTSIAIFGTAAIVSTTVLPASKRSSPVLVIIEPTPSMTFQMVS